MNLRLPTVSVFLAATLLSSPGCAVVTKGFHQQVAITSVPAGATVLVDGREAGPTPLTVNLTRAQSHRVELRKSGFAPALQSLAPEVTEYSHRLFRFGIDLDSGAASELTPAAVNVELVPEMLAAPGPGDAFEQMGAAVVAADDLWHRGAVSEADHRYLIEKIVAHFAR